MIQTSPPKKLQTGLLILAIFALASCDLLQESKPPTWTNTIEFPLINESVDLKDLEDEDNISSQLYGDNGERTIFAYSDTTEMASQEVGDQLAFGDINQTFSQSVDDVTVTGSTINHTSGFGAVDVAPIEKIISSTLGQIELSDIPPDTTEPFQLDEIFPGITAFSGQTVPVPGGNLEAVQKSFSFTDFSEAVFVGGSLDITINNDMVIILGTPINIQLKESNGTPITNASVTWNETIPQNTSSTKSLFLDGVTLPGDIFVEVTGATIGTNGVSIPVNATAISSSFDISISGSDLVVSSATAKVPSQGIDEDGVIAMAESENVIESARIKSGSLAIDIDNSMNVDADLVISIASLLDPGEVAFTTSIAIPANGSINDLTDIAGYFLAMELDQQEVQYSYQILTEDTGDNLVTLTENDQVSVSIALYGDQIGENLFFNRMTGIIEAQNIPDDGEINISSESTLLFADISEGSLTINVDNQVNRVGFDALPTIFLTIPELIENATSNPLTGSLTLEPNPAVNVLEFDLSDYGLDMDLDSQVLTYSTIVTTPAGEVGRFGLEDSIFVEILVSDLEFSTVTGFFSQDAMVDSNEIILNEATKLIVADFEAGDLALTMTNHIGVVADVEFQIDEFLRKDNGEMLRTSFRLEATEDPQISHIDMADYDLNFTAAVPGVDQAIHYVSTVTLPDDEEMTLTFGDSILIDVNITNLAMASVTGIIEPDTLLIDPDTVTFNLPDMVSDLMFEHVNIDIDFNSTFDIPIQLSLLLSGTDSLGNTEEIEIFHNLMPEDDVVHIDAADLLNIHPESIISSGQAIISDGTTASTIARGQSMSPVMYINVPLSLIIDDPPSLDMDVTSLDSPLPEEGTVTLEEFTIYADVTNMFEFGATVVVLASNDSLAFDSLAIEAGTAPAADTLLSLELLPLENVGVTEHEITTVEMTSDKLVLLEEKLFLKPEVKLLGRIDEGGNSIPSRFFTTDSLSIRTWGSISYTVHGEEIPIGSGWSN